MVFTISLVQWNNYSSQFTATVWEVRKKREGGPGRLACQEGRVGIVNLPFIWTVLKKLFSDPELSSRWKLDLGLVS